jgi:hypothetical protein
MTETDIKVRARALDVIENHARADGEPNYCIVHADRLRALADALAEQAQEMQSRGENSDV